MKNIFELDEYFSDTEILRILCRKRALLAKKIHDNHFLRNISSSAKNPNKNINHQLFSFFPSRKSWIRFGLTERNKRNTNAVELNALQLERTVKREKKRIIKLGLAEPVWLKNLNNFTSSLQKSALSFTNSYEIPKPNSFVVVKSLEKKEYRPISSFDLKNLIVIGQYSKYLTNCFDQLFLDCSYAFRTGVKKHKSFNHHEAIHDIIKYNHDNKGELYVAECDIKKFYDCVNHQVIKVSFVNFVNRANEELGIKIDERAINIFYSYLECFSFNEDIFKKEKELLINGGFKSGTIPWVSKEELESVGSNIETDRIGVPQGGALSCLIANILLDYVDQKVVETNCGHFYARFCDDMVLIHSHKEVCELIYKIYQKALVEVKLISHTPEEIDHYGIDFWGKKSKSPYKWGSFIKYDVEKRKNVPWLSFVGYQVRFDNLVRIRKSSIEKELRKQVLETDKIIRVLRKSKISSINDKAVIFRLRQRLISMSIGRVQMDKKSTSMCWSAGFKVIKSNITIKNQFVKLDRNREKQIKRMSRFVKIIGKVPRISAVDVKILKYYGSKYGYHDQFN
jgi:hypothetical protein